MIKPNPAPRRAGEPQCQYVIRQLGRDMRRNPLLAPELIRMPVAMQERLREIDAVMKKA